MTASISSISSVGTIITVTTTAPHPFASNQNVVLSGTGVPILDGIPTAIVVTGPSTFTVGIRGVVSSAMGLATLQVPTAPAGYAMITEPLGSAGRGRNAFGSAGSWRDRRF